MAQVECREPLANGHGHEAEETSSNRSNPMLAQLEAPWANSKFFAVDVLALGLLSSIMGVVSFGYGFVVGDCLSKWLTWAGDGKEYPGYYLETDSLGSPWWILLCWLGGTVVGGLKVLVGLDAFNSFLVEIREQHCDPMESLKTFVCCVATLVSGAAMGPEAGLAALGGGVGTSLAGLAARLGPEWAAQADERRRLYVLGGICAAFGTIMPSPWVSLLICMECSLLKADEEGRQLKVFGRRTLFILAYVATAAWVVRYAMKALPKAPEISQGLVEQGEAYDQSMPFKALLLGLIAAVCALVYAVTGAIVKVLFTRLGKAVEGRMGKNVRIMALCSLAGLVTGVLGYLSPMSLSSGKEALMPIIQHDLVAEFGGKAQLPVGSLVWIAFAKTLSYSCAAAGGMVGGPFFPILFIGVVVGELCGRIGFVHWSLHPIALTVPVTMVALPSSVFPIPFTFVAIPISYFHLGTFWCVPILVGIVTSYTLVVGSGLVHKLAKR